MALPVNAKVLGEVRWVARTLHPDEPTDELLGACGPLAGGSALPGKPWIGVVQDPSLCRDRDERMMMAVGAVGNRGVLRFSKLLWTHAASMGAAASTAVVLRRVGIAGRPDMSPSAGGATVAFRGKWGEGFGLGPRKRAAQHLDGPASVPNRSAGSDAFGAEPRCMELARARQPRPNRQA